MVVHTYFQLLNSDEEYQELECQLCGEVFVINWEDWTNLAHSENWNTLLPKCPSCGQIGDF